MSDVIGTCGGKRQLRQVRKSGGFTRTARRRFLEGLAATCNIQKAAGFAGVSPGCVYRHRARDAAFAEQWAAALAIGYDRLEALVLEHGGAGAEIEIDPERAEAAGIAPEPFDFERAMKVLVYRRGAREGQPNRRTGRPVRNAGREETTAALLKALAAAKRRVAARGEAGDE